MAFKRLLVAVDDSSAGLQAARVSGELAGPLGARLRFVHVLADGEVARRFTSARVDGTLRGRRVTSSTALLRHVLAAAEAARVRADVADLEGDPPTLILAEAAAWDADLVVLGRTRRRGAGRSYAGATAQHVLEFSEVPVLLVPGPPGSVPR